MIDKTIQEVMEEFEKKFPNFPDVATDGHLGSSYRIIKKEDVQDFLLSSLQSVSKKAREETLREVGESFPKYVESSVEPKDFNQEWLILHMNKFLTQNKICVALEFQELGLLSGVVCFISLLSVGAIGVYNEN